MKKRRKHRLYIDVLYTRSMTRREAAEVTQALLADSTFAEPVWLPTKLSLSRIVVIQPKERTNV